VKGAMRLLNIRTGPLRISREPLSPIRRADGKQLGIRTRGRHSGSRRSCRWPTERSQGLISRTEHTSRENGTSSALGLSLLSEAIRNGRISRH
jgi:hypothetical protein